MTEDFVTQLRVQLREAAVRRSAAGRSPAARPARRGRRCADRGAARAGRRARRAGAARRARAHGPEARRHVPGRLRPVVAGAGVRRRVDGGSDPRRGLRIDPATPPRRARIPVSGEARVAAGAGAVWALAGDLLYAGDQGPVRLLRIDPATNRVVARIPMSGPAGKRFGPLDLQVDGDAVWVVGAAGALRVDPRRNVPDRFVPIAEPVARHRDRRRHRVGPHGGRPSAPARHAHRTGDERGPRARARGRAPLLGPQRHADADRRERDRPARTGERPRALADDAPGGHPVRDRGRRRAVGPGLQRLRRARPARPARRGLRPPGSAMSTCPSPASPGSPGSAGRSGSPRPAARSSS